MPSLARVIDGLKDVLAFVKGDHTRGKVTPSCGCVFCDLKLEPLWHDGFWWHRKDGGVMVQCALPRAN